jgi:cyanuric acid amidohydrolase
MTRRAYVHRIATRSADDVAGLEAMIADARIDPGAIVAIFDKTEGNGCVNEGAST